MGSIEEEEDEEDLKSFEGGATVGDSCKAEVLLSDCE